MNSPVFPKYSEHASNHSLASVSICNPIRCSRSQISENTSAHQPLTAVSSTDAETAQNFVDFFANSLIITAGHSTDNELPDTFKDRSKKIQHKRKCFPEIKKVGTFEYQDNVEPGVSDGESQVTNLSTTNAFTLSEQLPLQTGTNERFELIRKAIKTSTNMMLERSRCCRTASMQCIDTLYKHLERGQTEATKFTNRVALLAQQIDERAGVNKRLRAKIKALIAANQRLNCDVDYLLTI